VAQVLPLHWREQGGRLAMGLCSRALARSKGVYTAGHTKSPSLSIGTTRLRALFLQKD
jgi:hypothetical protein